MARFNMLKFFADRGGEDHGGGHLFWPGSPDGLPFRGDAAPDLRKREMEELEVQADFHSKMFCLWKDEDHAEFNRIMERDAAGWYSVKKRYDHYEAEHHGYRVWLEWLQHYAVSPSGNRYDEW